MEWPAAWHGAEAWSKVFIKSLKCVLSFSRSYSWSIEQIAFPALMELTFYLRVGT